jgi:Uma2 family endonuclease
MHAEGVRRKVWTREEADKLTELFPDQRYELIEGELINMLGQSPPHAYVVALLSDLFLPAFPGRVRIRCPIVFPDPEGKYSEPEPDMVRTHIDDPTFFERHPGPEDIALVVEVADSSLNFDRSTKYRLYARTGIVEYWIVDVVRRRVFVCRSAEEDDYRSVTVFGAEEIISPVATPEFSLRVDQLFA